VAVRRGGRRGRPATGRTRGRHRDGLSADTVTAGPGDMFTLMRAAYALERLRDPGFTTRDVLRMATIEGAEVTGLADEGRSPASSDQSSGHDQRSGSDSTV
jgi:cytosine/adenosine deaminase-related metal-dependent hydrolase